MDLFNNNAAKYAPLADRMRPENIEEFVGQSHIINKNSILINSIKSGEFFSCIFYGPPGCGKTSFANIISKMCSGNFEKLNAVSSGVADAKAIIEKAKYNLELYGTKTFLLLDECHRWSKAQSDCVLDAIEKGYIIFIGSTTENPYISMTRAIVSRCRVYEFKPLSDKDILIALENAVSNKERGYGNYNVCFEKDCFKLICENCGGDLRNAYNILEVAFKSSVSSGDGVIKIKLKTIKECLQNNVCSLDANNSYDMLSAFCKSLRGSDTEGALFYSQKLIQSGYDPLILARRLVAHASEDIGMADSNAVLLAISALTSCEKLGMPECNLTLCHAIIYLCEAPKSNSVLIAKDKASADAEKLSVVNVPNAIKNHPTGYDDKSGNYKYPHDFGGYVKQQYLPNEIKDALYYIPSKNGKELNLIRKKVK